MISTVLKLKFLNLKLEQVVTYLRIKGRKEENYGRCRSLSPTQSGRS